MDGRQAAALGPRYADFKAVYGRSSGVALGCALAYGIDVDVFTRPAAGATVEGELVVKIWTRRSNLRILWCYVACDNGALSCFPLFLRCSAKADAPIRMAMDIPIGSRVRATFDWETPPIPAAFSAAQHGG